ncbi:hypothetical protein [Pseudomonas sp. EL_65y_Pfl2_R95]|uniref:hypothetical protein n=1 Tax=Pseudomonas sp. EL_65y_Pfl2_R95 TaxID=3088698 RepID=UPI0030DD4A3A
MITLKCLGSATLSLLVLAAPFADAGRLAGHGGGGGGVRAHSSVSHARVASQPRVQQNRNVQRNVSHNNPPVKRDSKVNIKNNNVNINNNRNRHGDVDIDVDHHGWGWNDDVDIDVDHNGRGDWDIDVDVDHRHPVATAAIVTGTVLAIGSMINTLPPSCQQVYRYGNEYYYCNNQYYQPQWNNNTVVYVVVDNP